LAACEQLYKAGYRNLYWLNGGFDAVQEGVLICVCLVDTYPLLMCAYYGSTVSCCKLQKFCDCSRVKKIKNFSFLKTLLLGTSSFIGEFLILVGAFQGNSLVATLAALGMILGAAYSLWLYNRVIFGKSKVVNLLKFIREKVYNIETKFYIKNKENRPLLYLPKEPITRPSRYPLAW